MMRETLGMLCLFTGNHTLGERGGGGCLAYSLWLGLLAWFFRFASTRTLVRSNYYLWGNNG